MTWGRGWLPMPKTCRVCGEVKPRSEFYAHATSADGLRSDCKECRKAHSRRNRQERLDHYRAYDRRRYQIPERRAQYQTPRALRYRRTYNRHYFAEHGDRVRRKQGPVVRAEYARARRARLLETDVREVTERDLNRMVARHGGLCAAGCGRSWEHWDHIIPLARGGRHAIGNLQPLCQPCNSEKSDRLTVEWKVWQEMVAA